MSSPHSPVFEALLPTPLGPMVALASDAALECLYFADQPHPPALSHLPASRLPALFLSSGSSPAARVLQATSQFAPAIVWWLVRVLCRGMRVVWSASGSC